MVSTPEAEMLYVTPPTVIPSVICCVVAFVKYQVNWAFAKVEVGVSTAIPLKQIPVSETEMFAGVDAGKIVKLIGVKSAVAVWQNSVELNPT